MTESEIVRTLAEENEDFKRLGEEHRRLDEKLLELQLRVYLTPEEEMEKKRMQKLKLAKKDLMARFIRDYRQSHSKN